MQTAMAQRNSGAAPGAAARNRKTSRGRSATFSGAAAETRTARRYEADGWRVMARNWRADRLHGGGEIDLIVARGDMLTFVEVKTRRSLGEAAVALRPAQRLRLEAAALRFSELHGEGLGEMRFDLALCDRDGRLEVLENAFA